MPYFVYILRTSHNTFYIGQTNNLERRLEEHKNNKVKSAKYIRYFPSFDLVYRETYPTRIEAMRREKQLKGWSRAKKLALIKGNLIELKRLTRSSDRGVSNRLAQTITHMIQLEYKYKTFSRQAC